MFFFSLLYAFVWVIPRRLNLVSFSVISPQVGDNRFFKYHDQTQGNAIQINQPTRCNSFTSLLFDVNVWLNMFWALPRPSSEAYNSISSLWFYRWSVTVAVLLVVVWKVTCHTNNAATVTLQQ
jgi:hypothetical protein